MPQARKIFGGEGITISAIDEWKALKRVTPAHEILEQLQLQPCSVQCFVVLLWCCNYSFHQLIEENKWLWKFQVFILDLKRFSSILIEVIVNFYTHHFRSFAWEGTISKNVIIVKSYKLSHPTQLLPCEQVQYSLRDIAGSQRRCGKHTHYIKGRSSRRTPLLSRQVVLVMFRCNHQ